MDNRIEVHYDGAYPNTCSGVLLILVDGERIYEERYACSSSGSAGVVPGGDEYCTPGQLTWDSEKQEEFSHWFDENCQRKGWKPSFLVSIQKAVRSALTEFSVCCGGCI